jgi:hypothetical protein
MFLLQQPLNSHLFNCYTSLTDTDRDCVPGFLITQVRMAAATAKKGSARPSSVWFILNSVSTQKLCDTALPTQATNCREIPDSTFISRLSLSPSPSLSLTLSQSLSLSLSWINSLWPKCQDWADTQAAGCWFVSRVLDFYILIVIVSLNVLLLSYLLPLYYFTPKKTPRILAYVYFYVYVYVLTIKCILFTQT